MIKIDFEFETENGRFCDALYLPEGHGYSDQQIEDMKAERLNAWLAAISNPVDANENLVVIDGVVYEKIDLEGQTMLKPVVG